MSKERKALGTGLSVLFGDDEIADSASKTVLPLSRIEPRTEQPRNYFDEDALQALAESIRQFGIIQPITVRKLDSGMYQIIAGERRWRAARIAGLDEIPVNIIEADDRTTAELALVENLQREDLNPIEEALGYKTLIGDFGLTQEEAAKSVGRSRSAITNSLRLLNLSDPVRHFVETNELSAGHARALVAITDETAQLSAANQILAKSLSVRSTERLVNSMLKPAAVPPEKKKPNADGIDYGKELEKELSKLLGRKVTICSGKQSGKIEIEYYSDDDREVLINKLRLLK